MAIVVVMAYIIWRWTGMVEEEISPGVQMVPEETRAFTLFFVNKQADGLLSETREMVVGEGLEEQVKAVVSALIEGTHDDDKISAIPEGTKVVQVFWEEETRTLFIDFNRALITAHTGGSTAEYYTISMILRTIGSNFPQVSRFQFLVDGYPVETIAGHYAVDRPLEIMRWR